MGAGRYEYLVQVYANAGPLTPANCSYFLDHFRLIFPPAPRIFSQNYNLKHNIKSVSPKDISIVY